MSSAPKKTVGNNKTEQIIGTAAVKLKSAVENLASAVAQAVVLEQTLTEGTLKAADLEQKIINLQTEYEQRNAEMKFEQELRFKTNEASFANQYLNANGMMAVKVDHYNKLNDDYKTLQTEFSTRISAEVEKARAAAETEYRGKEALLNAQYEAKEAGNIAQIHNLNSQLESAHKTSEVWRTQLESEREASVKRAQAGAVGAINVTGPSGR